MRTIARGVGFFLAAAIFLSSGAVSADEAPAEFVDNPNPNNSGYAADVVLVDLPWEGEYADYEGSTAPSADDYYDDTPDPTPDLKKRAAKDFYLRVMPLGASIVEGVASSDKNGFRKLLRSQLRYAGWGVNMVGSKQDGTMVDRDNEGHPGWVTDQIKNDAWNNVKWMKPNVILLNAGTNDCNYNTDPDNAGKRLKALTDDIFNTLPNVTLIMSTLSKSRDHNACAVKVSEQFRSIFRGYKSQGKRVALADIDKYMTANDLASDGIHPNDNGYKIFAGVWWGAIKSVEDKIQAPPDVKDINDKSNSAPNTCAKVAGNARGPVQSQKGSGHDDGNYVHNRVERGLSDSARIEKRDDPKEVTDGIPWHIFFANIVVNNPSFERKEAQDDWIRIFHDPKTGKNTYYYRQNIGNGNFGPTTTFDVGQDCDAGPLYAFADFNDDGLDDFFCLKAGSAVSVSLNKGGSPPRFVSIGQVVPTHDGFVAANVRIGDIDGDGRADYCLTKSGNLVCSRNGGQGDNYFWQGFSTQDGLRGVVFDKKSTDGASVVLGDINGDFRSDLLIVTNDGKVETWINQRGWGPGIGPDWKSAGITHLGVGAKSRDQIKFARIYGSGRLDYVYLKEEDKHFDVYLYENKGSGGTKRKADGNYYCDMRGTGADDYVWIWSDGHAAEIYANVHNPPFWGPNVKIELSVPSPRAGIHLADWNGDGRCDVLVQNKKDGALTLYQNNWDEKAQKLTFTNKGVVTPGWCDAGWGVSPFDRNMRLADLDGDGRADPICIRKDGYILAYLNKANELLHVGQIKRPEGWDRANLRFHDVEASGRADIIWLNKYTGAGTVFKNNGHMDGGGGSSFSWTARGVLYSPIDRGETTVFTNQGGLGRADLVQVLPVSNTAYTHFNECKGGSGGDDGAISNPNLPEINDDQNSGNGGGGGSGSGHSIPRPDDDYYESDGTATEGPGPSDPEILNRVGTYIEKFYGCSQAQTDAISKAYLDANKLVNQETVYNPQWNWMPTQDFFGPDGLINPWAKAQIENVLRNVATVSPGTRLNPWKWRITVRCNENPEYQKRCSQELSDPCRPPAEPVPRLIAYTRNKQSDMNYPEITFCPPFFELKNLDDAMAYGESKPFPERSELSIWDNQASKFLHELFHCDFAANSWQDSPNPHIMDLTLAYRRNGRLKKGPPIYGPRFTKILAKYNAAYDPIGVDVGFYTQRNADNYALFCMAMYVFHQTEYYPFLPLIDHGLNNPPHDADDKPLLPPSAFWEAKDDLTGFEVPGFCDWDPDDITLNDFPTDPSVVGIRKLVTADTYSQQWRDEYDAAYKSIVNYYAASK